MVALHLGSTAGQERLRQAEPGGPGGLGTRQRPAEACHEAVGGGGMRFIACIFNIYTYMYIYVYMY